MEFYVFMHDCQDRGLSADEAIREWYEACAEEQSHFEENYESDLFVTDGWRQEDTIAMYRRER